MKTTTNLLMSLIVLAGSLVSVQAANERTSRIVKKTTVTRVASSNDNRSSSRTQQKAENIRAKIERAQVKVEASRAEAERKREVRSTQIRIESNRNQERAETDIQIENTRDRSQSSVNVRMENEQSRVTGHPLNRSTQITFRNDRPQYREYRHHCIYCSGRGFTLSFNGLRHLGCTHCSGLGYYVMKELYLNTLAYSGNYTLSQLARIETDQLDAVLQLTRRQWDKVYRINYRYLVRNEGRRYYPFSEKVEDIQNVLNDHQNMEYAYYLEELEQDQYAYELHY